MRRERDVPTRRRRAGMRAAVSASLLVLVSLLPRVPADAVIVMGAPGRNLDPPTGSLANSGWQYEGNWGVFSGTAIGPHHFITAKHVGGWVGQTFIYRGKEYETINVVHFPECDLALWTVAEPFPDYAPLYTGKSEVGRPVIIFGRGTSRGRPVYADGRLRGWRWGPSDGKRSWGTSQVIGTLPQGLKGAPEAGEKLVFDFSEAGGPNEGSVSSGDSGGGVFLWDGSGWKLAGVNYGVSAIYSLTGTDASSFSGAIFDGRGMWRGTGGVGYAYTGELDPYDASTLSFSTRLSAYMPQIQRILAEPHRRMLVTRRNFLLLFAPLFALALAAYVIRARHLLRKLLRGKR